MAKRLFITSNVQDTNTGRFRTKILDLINKGMLTNSDVNILRHVTSNSLAGSVYLVDVSQATGDLIAAEPGVIEVPLNILPNDISTVATSQAVTNINNRIGYDISQTTVRNALYALIGHIIIHGNGQSLD